MQASTKGQSRGLVYTDVVSFQQELHVCPFDPNNKIEYAQVKGPSNDFPMQLTSSLQRRSHSAGRYTYNTIMYAEYDLFMIALLC